MSGVGKLLPLYIPQEQLHDRELLTAGSNKNTTLMLKVEVSNSCLKISMFKRLFFNSQRSVRFSTKFVQNLIDYRKSFFHMAAASKPSQITSVRGIREKKLLFQIIWNKLYM